MSTHQQRDKDPWHQRLLHKVIGGIKDAAAGVTGGVSLVMVGQPFDTVKVRMQTNSECYRGPWHCFTSTLKNEGIRGLYSGTVPALLSNISENGVLFLCYGQAQAAIKSFQHDPSKPLSSLQMASAGALAAVASSLVLCPTELVKCRLQVQQIALQQNKIKELTYKGPFHCTLSIIKNDGVGGLFRGLTSTWLREIPGTFVYFGAYEGIKALIMPSTADPNNLNPLQLIFAGGMSGAIYWVAMYPFDAVKSRIQVADGVAPSFFGALRSIVRNEGVSSLYKGLQPALIRSFPANAALFLAYETTRKMLA